MQNVQNFAREIDDTSGQIVEPKWAQVLQRQHVVSGKGNPDYGDIMVVNALCNSKPYKTDPTWPTPEEFARAATGDCKGFAICKYYALRRVGFRPEQLNLWSGDYDGHSHMILVVSLNGKQYVMDSGAEVNLPEAKDYFYKHFQPAYRFNEKGWDVN